MIFRDIKGNGKIKAKRKAIVSGKGIIEGRGYAWQSINKIDSI